MLAELYVPAFRTFMCVRRLRGGGGGKGGRGEDVVFVTYFF